MPPQERPLSVYAAASIAYSFCPVSLKTSIFSFTHNVFYLSKNNFQPNIICCLQIAFNLDQSKNVLFDKVKTDINDKENNSYHISQIEIVKTHCLAQVMFFEV